jgi:hypothetical protein
MITCPGLVVRPVFGPWQRDVQVGQDGSLDTGELVQDDAAWGVTAAPGHPPDPDRVPAGISGLTGGQRSQHDAATAALSVDAGTGWPRSPCCSLAICPARAVTGPAPRAGRRCRRPRGEEPPAGRARRVRRLNHEPGSPRWCLASLSAAGRRPPGGAEAGVAPACYQPIGRLWETSGCVAGWPAGWISLVTRLAMGVSLAAMDFLMALRRVRKCFLALHAGFLMARLACRVDFVVARLPR